MPCRLSSQEGGPNKKKDEKDKKKRQQHRRRYRSIAGEGRDVLTHLSGLLNIERPPKTPDGSLVRSGKACRPKASGQQEGPYHREIVATICFGQNNCEFFMSIHAAVVEGPVHLVSRVQGVLWGRGATRISTAARS